MAGLSDWTIDESKMERLAGTRAHRMKMSGHYIGVENQPVEFVEWAYFIGDRYYQVSFHQPGRGPASSSKRQETRVSDDEVRHALSQFIPEGL